MRRNNRTAMIGVGVLIAVVAVIAIVFSSDPNLLGTAGGNGNGNAFGLTKQAVEQPPQEQPTQPPPTQEPPTQEPPTQPPPTQPPPTQEPPTQPPPTQEPPTPVPPTPVPPTQEPPTQPPPTDAPQAVVQVPTEPPTVEQITPVPPTVLVPPTVEQITPVPPTVLVPPTVEQITPVPPTALVPPTVEQITPVPPTVLVPPTLEQITPVPPTQIPPTQTSQSIVQVPTEHPTEVPSLTPVSQQQQQQQDSSNIQAVIPAVSATPITVAIHALCLVNSSGEYTLSISAHAEDYRGSAIYHVTRADGLVLSLNSQLVNPDSDVAVPDLYVEDPTQDNVFHLTIGGQTYEQSVSCANAISSDDYKATRQAITPTPAQFSISGPAFTSTCRGTLAQGYTLRAARRVNGVTGTLTGQLIAPSGVVVSTITAVPRRGAGLAAIAFDNTPVLEAGAYTIRLSDSGGHQATVDAAVCGSDIVDPINSIALATATADAAAYATALVNSGIRPPATPSNSLERAGAIANVYCSTDLDGNYTLNTEIRWNGTDGAYQAIAEQPDGTQITLASQMWFIGDSRIYSDHTLSARVSVAQAGNYRITFKTPNGHEFHFNTTCMSIPPAEQTAMHNAAVQQSVNATATAVAVATQNALATQNTIATATQVGANAFATATQAAVQQTQIANSLNATAQANATNAAASATAIADQLNATGTALAITATQIANNLNAGANAFATATQAAVQQTQIANSLNATAQANATDVASTATAIADQLNATGTAVVATATQVANNLNATVTALVQSPGQVNPTATLMATSLPTATQPAVAAPERPVNPAQCTRVTNAPAEVVAVLDALLAQFTDTTNVNLEELLPSPGAVIRVETPDWVYYEALGLANVETGELLRCDQRFQIGSNTKMMTAVLLLQLVEEEKLSLDDHLSDYLPDYAAALPFGDRITLRQLANHTSGIFSYTDDAPDGAPGLMEGDTSSDTLLRQGYTPDELVQFATEHGQPYFEPGAEGQFHYSNTNYALLGLIIEQVTGQDIGTLYQDRIFTPLGMERTFLWNDVPLDAFDLPQGYLKYPFDLNTTAWNMSQGWAAGAVISTADDMRTFLTALLKGELFQNPDTLTTMQETVHAGGLGEYGIGLIKFYLASPDAWGHGGQTLGFESSVGYVAQGDVSIVVWTNASSDYAAYGVQLVEQALVEAGVLSIGG